MNPLDAMLDGHIINEEYSMPSMDYIDLLLKNNLQYGSCTRTTTFGMQRESGIFVDAETEYYLNNFGYRDSDWNSEAEILAIGCSNTFGYGVSIDGRWTNILEKNINKKIRNLSIPGGAISELVFKSFEYFKIFGNPKIMFCLFPDPFRIKLPIKKNLNNGSFSRETSDRYGYDTDLYLSGINFDPNLKFSERSKYFKIPYFYQDVLPLELPIFFSMKSIHMLEQYCKSNNIKLIWSFWHNPIAQVLINSKQDIFNNFFVNEDFIINHHPVNGPEIFTKNCHEEYRNEFEKYFDGGLDVEDSIDLSHPGVHKHIHIAEAFYKEINK